MIDFGENGAGWTRLHVKNHILINERDLTYSKSKLFQQRSSKGAQIYLAHGEMINSKTGDLFNQYACPVPSRVCVNQTDHFISNGEEVDEHEYKLEVLYSLMKILHKDAVFKKAAN